MARTRTLLQLRTDVRQRADLVSSTFITDAELTEYINGSIADLFDRLVASRGMDYYEKVPPYSFTTVGGTSLYSLPADFYQLILCEATIGSYTVPLQPFALVERGRLSQQPVQGGLVVTVRYVPTCPRLVNDSDTFDGFNGWEEFVILDAALKCREKEETDATDFQARLARMVQRLDRMAPDRDAGMGQRFTDVRRSSLTPFGYVPKPRYRIHGNTDVSGSAAPNLELVSGPLPGSVW